MDIKPIDTEYESRIRASFERQQVMNLIGAKLTKVAPGEIRIEMPYSVSLTQQHGYIHAGIVTTIVDSACGYAAYTLMPKESSVLSVEFKINLLSPAKGEMFIATGKVLKAGRTLTICQGEVTARDGGEEKLVSVMQATMMTVAKAQQSK